MSFFEITFPENIAYGSSFGPGWQTNVIRIRSGHEQRNQRWSHPLYKGDVSYGVKKREDMNVLIAFFQEVRGRTYGFRFKDWSDFEAINENLDSDGSPVLQLIKTYGTNTYNYIRDIKKPRTNVSLKRNGSSYTSFVLDTTTGKITLTADSTVSISNIAQDASGTVTATGHGFSTGDAIYIDGVSGMTEVNETVYTITVVTVDTFELGVDTTGYTAYSSGGTAYYYVQPSETLTWSGEFDVPMRFDTDEISTTWETYELSSTSVPVVEVRV